MRKKYHTWISLTGLLLIATNGFASEVSITNTFSSGTPAKADEVNQNFTDIKTAVDDNNSRISANTATTTSNASQITSNTTAISGNTTAISGNTGTINTLGTSINANTTNIDSLNTTVSTNASDIANLNTSVGTNTTAIQSLNTSVASNSADIANNTSSIESNTAQITTNETAISSFNQAVSIYEGTDNRLGRFLGTTSQIENTYSKMMYQGSIVWLLSDTGYLFALERWYSPTTSTLRGIDYFQVPTTSSDFVISTAKIYYETNNCTGQEYLSTTQLDYIAYTGFSPVISMRGGIVFRVIDMSGIAAARYLPKGTSSIPIAYESSRDMDSTSCIQTTPTDVEYVLAISPNEPAVTGVSDTITYTQRLTFGY